MIAIISVSILTLVCAAGFMFFSVSPKGFVDFRLGFLLIVSKLLAIKAGKTDPKNLAERREKTISDIAFVSKKYSGVQVVERKAADRIPVRMYSAGKTGNLPLIIFFHGGGYVLGDLSYGENLCKALVLKTDALVVSVDYRLAPENPFPAALEDAKAALDWVIGLRETETDFHFDSKKIFVMGDSAGGNLAAALCLALRDSGREKLIKGQILIYPVTDFSDMSTDSYRRFNLDYMLSKTDMEWFRECYLPNPEDWKNPHASPVLTDNPLGLPDAFICTAEFDVLRDEGKKYADKLRGAGNKVTFMLMKGLAHGFLVMDAYLPQTNKVYKAIREFIK